MNEINYIATSRDTGIVSEGMEYLFKAGLKAIFKKFERIENTPVISYD